jgi:hypothetical protein
MSDYQEMITHFEKLRKDLHEDRLSQSQRQERTEEKVKRLESESIINRTFVGQVQKHMQDWERMIPELVHGAVKECMSFELTELKNRLDEHIDSDNPHVKATQTKREKAVTRRKWLIATAISIVGSSAGTYFFTQVLPKLIATKP